MDPVASCPISAKGAIISFSSSNVTKNDFLCTSKSSDLKFKGCSFSATYSGDLTEYFLSHDRYGCLSFSI